MLREVITRYFQMTDPAQLRPARSACADFVIRQARSPSPELNRFLYTAVGGDWHWIDRLSWTYARWLDYLARPELETWVGYEGGTPAGYFELEAQSGQGTARDVEIAYFGLLPLFIGRGLGGPLLTAAVKRAWEMGVSRVWLHTCTLDHSSAAGNYEARGFRLYKEETKLVDLPDESPGPWPGAGRARSASVQRDR